ncbi:MAG: hypothetical protein GWO00_20820, partial [Gemmatimonadetes bacterium]|nr:hypothetical protein [Actinomycetota bacterium]NIR80708.1 hypothetical protein [Gemmatimonadota bacterium]NIT89512.1 hypothetical protein [Gemmatimonadota bacterium]NIU33306.1 hypothetical protein [Gemmatimonadota bacterium]NIV63641.1 hypothetical protein [Gemmatimonadota bacterium]
ASEPYGPFLGLSSTELDLSLDRILLPESEIRRVDVTAAGGAEGMRVEAHAEVDDRRGASIRVHVDPHPDRRTVRIEDVR